METEKTVVKGWLEGMQESVNNFIASFDIRWEHVAEWGIAFVVGSITGLLVKRFGRQIIFVLVLFAAGLLILSYLNVITFDWIAFKNIFGLHGTQTIEELVQNAFSYASEKIVAVILAVIGFVIGYRLT